MKTTAICFFPKSIKENITMSSGADIYSERAFFFILSGFARYARHSMVNVLFQQAEIPLFSRVEDKKRPCMSFVKSFNARSFCLCRRVSHFCPYQNKWQCPVTENLFPLNGSRWFRCDIIHDTVNMLYFVYDAARDFI